MNSVKPISICTIIAGAGGRVPNAKPLQTRQAAFNRTLRSLTEQGLPHWQWCIAATAADAAVIKTWLDKAQLTREQRRQVRIIACEEKGSMQVLSHLVTAARGDWVGFCFLGDAFAPHFVYEGLRVSLTQDNASLMYFDDDVIKNNRAGSLLLNRHLPYFKPDFSLDFLLTQNYLGLSFIVKKSVLRSVLRDLASGQALARATGRAGYPYALALTCVDRVVRGAKVSRQSPAFPIAHVPLMLRHRDRTSPESAWHEQSKAAARSAKALISSFCRSQGLAARVTLDADGLLHTTWPVASGSSKKKPRVSIIVPTKDQGSVLKKCIDSVIAKTTYSNYELIVVDNQTTEPKALRYLKSLQDDYDFVTVLRYDKPFNFSAINNEASEVATGDVLVLMNNDVEVIDGGWLREMVSHAVRPDVGCVGAKLLFPDRTIQHAGVALGMHGVADHMYRGLRESKRNDPYGVLRSVRNPAAVTGAVLAIRRSLYQSLGGLDAKRFQVAFNDVDLCLRAEEAGYRTVWTPDACLFHHESKTRAPRTALLNEIGAKARATERQEVASMRRRWGGLLKRKQQALGARFAQLRAF